MEFHAQCVNILVDNSLFKEVDELVDAKMEGKSEEEIAVIEKQQELRFDRSLTNRLMSIPYIVWKRKGIIKYLKKHLGNLKIVLLDLSL